METEHTQPHKQALTSEGTTSKFASMSSGHAGGLPFQINQ